MSKTPAEIQRIDWKELPTGSGAEGAAPVEAAAHWDNRPSVRWSILPLSLLLCLAQSVFIIIAEQFHRVNPAATIISIGAFSVIFLVVLCVNPLLAWAAGGRFFRPFNRPELVCVFAALMISSGLSSYGWSAHLVPMMATPWNADLNTPQRGWSESLTSEASPTLNTRLYLTDPETIRVFREGAPIQPPHEGAPLGEIVSYYVEVAAFVPWREWFQAFVPWAVFFIICFTLFYSLAYVVLRYWVEREKLIFPLAQLSMDMLPDEGGKRIVPAIVRAPLFWAGFSLSFLVLGWNGCVAAGWIPDTFQIQLGLSRGGVSQLFRDTFLDALAGGATLSFEIIFTAIGIAFLLPVAVSFSIWFYYLVGILLVLCAVWMGFGQTSADFPSNFVSTANFRTAQGGGGLFLIAAISLWRSLADYCRLARGKPFVEAARLVSPVGFFFLSLAALTLWFRWNSVPMLWAATASLFVALLSLGLMRLVAETGVFRFQTHFGAFHFYESFGLGKFFPPALAAPIAPLMSIMFMDTKTFLPPQIIIGSKMQYDARSGRLLYHLNIWACVLVTMVFAVVFTIFLAYLRGGQQMNAWFFTGMPTRILDYAAHLGGSLPQLGGAHLFWFGFGASWVAASVFIRQRLLWFPHPIGYVLFFAPLSGLLAFSFFLGWTFKKIAVKYGGKSTFDRIKPIFIGLIIGELMAIAVWLLLGLRFDFSSGIDLN